MEKYDRLIKQEADIQLAHTVKETTLNKWLQWTLFWLGQGKHYYEFMLTNS